MEELQEKRVVLIMAHNNKPRKYEMCPACGHSEWFHHNGMLYCTRCIKLGLITCNPDREVAIVNQPVQ